MKARINFVGREDIPRKPEETLESHVERRVEAAAKNPIAVVVNLVPETSREKEQLLRAAPFLRRHLGRLPETDPTNKETFEFLILRFPPYAGGYLEEELPLPQQGT